MLQELSMTPATVVIVAVIAVLTFLAIRRMARKGLCDCGKSEECSTCSKCKCSESGECKHSEKNGCAAAAHMIERAIYDDAASVDVARFAACSTAAMD